MAEQMFCRIYFYSCEQRAKRTYLYVYLATAARVESPVACCGVLDLFNQRGQTYEAII